MVSRRDFLRIGAGILGAGAFGLSGCGRRSGGDLAAGGSLPAGDSPAAQHPTHVGNNRIKGLLGGVNAAVASGEGRPPAELVGAALAACGGPEAFISSGDTVVIKPNLAWGRTPEQAACVSPAVLAAVIEICQQAGAGEVLVVEHPRDHAATAFEMSGAKDVCSGLGVHLIPLVSESLYQEVELPAGVNIKRDQIARDILECDVLVNVPTLKVHSATEVTLALKNQLGAIYDPQRYHLASSGGQRDVNLHQNIADLASALRPTINILDATRALTTGGAKGPGIVKQTNTIIAGSDIVTVDALGAQLLGFEPEQIAHIKLASDAGLGEMNEARMQLARG